jgi:hypothetical protein
MPDIAALQLLRHVTGITELCSTSKPIALLA